MLSVAIIYRADEARPLGLGETQDRRLLRDAAAAMVSEARESAEALAKVDPVLGEVQTAEADKLEKILGPLLSSKENLPVC